MPHHMRGAQELAFRPELIDIDSHRLLWRDELTIRIHRNHFHLDDRNHFVSGLSITDFEGVLEIDKYMTFRHSFDQFVLDFAIVGRNMPYCAWMFQRQITRPCASIGETARIASATAIQQLHR